MNPESAPPAESRLVLIALCAISMSTLIVEIALTKFVAYKVFHHYTYAILAMVIFSLGAAGVFVYLFPGLYQGDEGRGWRSLHRVTSAYPFALLGAILLFCWIPLDPYDVDLSETVRAASLPLYMLLFFVPFFLAGIAICTTLLISRRSVNMLYFWDILAAAVGTALSIGLLGWLGGYGTMLVAALAGYAASLAYARLAGIRPGKVVPAMLVLLVGIFLAYPRWARDRYVYDIRSTKDSGHRSVVAEDFHGLASTHWNPIARIDISHTGNSASEMYGWGFSKKVDVKKITGRYVLVDGGANTRQFQVDGDVRSKKYLEWTLWASPYIAHPPSKDSRTLVIGGGGGIDVLIAKYFGVSAADVVELNPSTYAMLTGTLGDAENHLYQPWLASDAMTEVTYYNREGRHHSTTQPEGRYDFVVASGVDTLTAITTGGMSLTENYLYTQDAIADYWRILKPDGLLSLSHWRVPPPTLSLRMFLTYVHFLESRGIEEPWRHLVIAASHDWNATMMKKSPFTVEDVDRMEAWAKEKGLYLLFNPTKDRQQLGAWKSEAIYALGYMKPDMRARILETYNYDVFPVTDDAPYFYQGTITTPEMDSMDPTLWWLTGSAAAAALILVFLPFLKLGRRDITSSILDLAWYFALCGFAFMMFETGLIQMFGIFVGGPTYSLAFVLISVLIGYSLGCRIAQELSPVPSTFLLLGASLLATMLAIHFFLPALLKACMPLPLPGRIVLTIALALVPSILAGIPVSLAMEAVRTRHGAVVVWMWSINSAFNVLAAVAFVPLTVRTGISFALALAGGLYAVACSRLYFSPPAGDAPEPTTDVGPHPEDIPGGSRHESRT